MPAFPFAALCLAATPLLTPTLQIGLSVATALTCMSQQFHAWAHTKASRLPAPVRAMQVWCYCLVKLSTCVLSVSLWGLSEHNYCL